MSLYDFLFSHLLNKAADLWYTIGDMDKKDRKLIVVITATAHKARRDKLAGIYDYAHDKGWLVQSIEESSNASLLNSLLRSGDIDGIISDGFNAPVTVRASSRRGIPTVYIDRPGRGRHKECSVNNDDDACARLAAQTLANLGLRQYATVGTTPSVYWSKRRMRVFADAVRGLGHVCASFRPSNGATDDLSRLRDWLQGLPRPCGLFAVTDNMAKRCIDLLTGAGIRVPEEFAVIGIDNDELVCENTIPTISSILPGFRQAGRLAAERLHRLMDGIGCEGLQTTYEPQTVVRRGSTSRVAIRQDKMLEVLEFIRRHACLGIRVADVVDFAGMPKSTLELHFRQATSRSIQDEIQRVRLAEVERLLRETRCYIGSIANRCGYRNDNYLKNLFKRTHGQTLSQYRRTCQWGQGPS